MHPALRMPLSDAAIARLERATADAVAPAQVLEHGDWLLSLDHSTIGRAKSAVPLRHHGRLATDVAPIAQHYRDNGLEPHFRVPDLPALEPVHRALRALGLEPTQPTWVQVACVDDVLALPTGVVAQVHLRPTPAWGEVYTAPGFDPVDGAHRRRALSRSPHVVYAHVQQDGAPVAAGTAALSQGWASIHGMRTVTAARGQGLASAILVALARHAQAQGYRELFLQVEAANAVAQSLYRRAGFQNAWRYHYWR